MRGVFRLAPLLTLLLAACAGQLTPPPDPAPTPPPPALPPITETRCADQFFAGTAPTTLEPNAFLCRRAYALLHSPARKTPLVVAEHLQASNLDGPITRTNDYRPDPELPVGARAELSDYRGSGWDRGHMAPANDFSTDPVQMSESFLLSNFVPQNRALNAGWWEGLESATRACARSLGAVFVLTGPVFSNPSSTIGPGAVNIPSSLYKIIVSSDGGSRAYLIANAPATQKGFAAYQVSISRLEGLTGLRFFSSGTVDADALGSLCTGAYGS